MAEKAKRKAVGPQLPTELARVSEDEDPGPYPAGVEGARERDDLPPRPVQRAAVVEMVADEQDP